MRMHSEYEVIHYSRLKHVHIGFVEILYRNFHIHREFEFGIVIDGAARISLGRESFDISRGTLYVINPNEPHEFTALSDKPLRLAYIQISNSFCREYMEFFHNLRFLEHDLTRDFTAAYRKHVTRLMLRAFDHYLSDAQTSSLDCMSDLIALISALVEFIPYQVYDDEAYLAQNKRAGRIEQVQEYVEAHCSEKLSLADLAQRMELNSSYLSDFIHKNLGMTFQTYVSSVRLERAVPLLLNRNMRMIDVCMESGFSDVKYLTRVFRERFGCTPKEFRRSRPALGASPGGGSFNQRQTYASYEEGMQWLRLFCAALDGEAPSFDGQ